MRKLGMKIAVAAAVFCMAMPFASFAGTWKSDANGMWYQFDDGSYPKEDGHGSIRTMMEWQRASILMKTAMS